MTALTNYLVMFYLVTFKVARYINDLHYVLSGAV